MQLQGAKSDEKVYMLYHLQRFISEYDFDKIESNYSIKNISKYIFMRRFINEIIFETLYWLKNINNVEIVSLNGKVYVRYC